MGGLETKERTMKTSTKTRRRRLWIAAALASALVAAPTAQARLDEGGGGAVEMPESSYVPFVTDFPRAAPAPGGDGTLVDYRRVAVARGASAFDWGDAFIGAGGTLALLLLAGGAALARRHVSRPSAA
jgi:uncharacterized protein (TIGR03382 family)